MYKLSESSCDGNKNYIVDFVGLKSSKAYRLTQKNYFITFPVVGDRKLLKVHVVNLAAVQDVQRNSRPPPSSS